MFSPENFQKFSIFSKIEINRIDDGLLNINCVEPVSVHTWNFENSFRKFQIFSFAGNRPNKTKDQEVENYN